jgi:hypothetical protein
MRRRRNLLWIGIAAGLWTVGIASGAGAATLPFVGQLALSIAALDPIAIDGAGFAVVEGRSNDPDHLMTMRIEASLFGTTGVIVPVTDPAAFPINGVIATAHNAAGGFQESNGTLGGVLPILGVAKVCLFGTCSSPLANLSVPLSVVGNGGLAYVTGAVNLTVGGAPWTTGTVFVGTSTAAGFAHGPASGTTSTLNPSGVVRLVTPIFISTNIGASASVPAFGFLTLHFVPEPATALLLGAGIAGLIVGGRRSS